MVYDKASLAGFFYFLGDESELFTLTPGRNNKLK